MNDFLTSRGSTASGHGAYYRGRHHFTAPGRAGYRVAKPVHRHRSLVLNNANTANNSNHAIGPASDDTSSSWVTRNDRHLQLINSSVFQEQSEARTKAMQQTRLQKQQEKEHRERIKLMNHLKHTARPSTTPANPTSATAYEISVEGVRFRVANNGSKLVKLPGASHPSLLCVRILAHQRQEIPMAPRPRRNWPWSEASSFIGLRTATCTVRRLSRPIGMSPFRTACVR